MAVPAGSIVVADPEAFAGAGGLVAVNPGNGLSRAELEISETQECPDPVGGPTNGVGDGTVPSVSANGRYVSYVQATAPSDITSPYELVRLVRAGRRASAAR